jgi:hypothetical protein
LPPAPNVPWVFSKDATCTGTHENLIQLTMGIFVQREAATGCLNEDIDSGRGTFKLNADRACKCAIERLGSADDNIQVARLSDGRTSADKLKSSASSRGLSSEPQQTGSASGRFTRGVLQRGGNTGCDAYRSASQG